MRHGTRFTHPDIAKATGTVGWMVEKEKEKEGGRRSYMWMGGWDNGNRVETTINAVVVGDW
jgi:hypothetical protein